MSKNNIADVFQLQTQAILNRITLLATETKEQKEVREQKEEIEREEYKWIHGGGNSTHGPL